MLSLILYRLFRIAFFLCLLSAVAAIISQLIQKPLSFSMKDNSTITLAYPGMLVSASKNSLLEKNAPNIIVKTSVYFPDGTMRSSGETTLNASNAPVFDTVFAQQVKEDERRGMKVIRDTQTILLWHQSWDQALSLSSSRMDSLDDGRVVAYKESTFSNGRKVESRDTLANMETAKIFVRTNERANRYNLAEEMSDKRFLRIMPGSSWQVAGFVLFDAIRYSCTALLLLVISRLFQNFYKRQYFTQPNVKLLKWAGWYLIIPQFLLFVVYWLFLFYIHPVKLKASSGGDVDFIAQYEMNSEIEIMLIVLGLSMLTLSYIFRDGMRLKEEEALTI